MSFILDTVLSREVQCDEREEDEEEEGVSHSSNAEIKRVGFFVGSAHGRCCERILRVLHNTMSSCPLRNNHHGRDRTAFDAQDQRVIR